MRVLLTRRMRTLITFKPNKVRGDWKNKEFRCDECGCRFDLQADDKPVIFAKIIEVDAGSAGLNDFVKYFVFCPEGCGNLVEVSSSPMPSKDDYKHLPTQTNRHIA